MSAAPARPLQLLLVDDDPGDVALICDALTKYKQQIEVHTAADGIEALEFLRRDEGHAGAPRPDLILLDLNMPRMDGREVLAVIKQDPQWVTIPVVVLTTSEQPDDITASYTAHANAYVTKPLDLDQLDHAVSQIYSFYGQLVVRTPATGTPDSDTMPRSPA